jgi:hypothetical protein
MTSQIVNLAVTATIPIDCDFWSEDDGWKGCCKSPSVTVNGRSIEDAKKNMATELQTHIERILCPATRGVSLIGQTLKAQPSTPPGSPAATNARDAVGVGPR